MQLVFHFVKCLPYASIHRFCALWCWIQRQKSYKLVGSTQLIILCVFILKSLVYVVDYDILLNLLST